MKAMNKFLTRLQLPEVREEQGLVLPMHPAESSEECTEYVNSAVHERTEPVHGMFRSSTQDVHTTLNKRAWQWKARRNNGNLRPYMLFRACASGVAVATALYTTYIGADIECCISWYLIALAAILVCDPVGCVERVLALPTRVITAVDIFLYISTLYIYEERYSSVVLILEVITIAIMIVGNKFWLKSENWLYSDSVEHALTIDPDNEASEYWHGAGRREVRTLLHQIGHDVSEHDLDGMMMPVFALGFWAEYERKTKMQNEIAALEEDLSSLDEYAAELEDHISRFEDKEKRIDAIIAERDRLKQALEDSKANFKFINVQFQNSMKEKNEIIDKLQTVPEEEPEADIPTDKEALAEYIMELYNSSEDMSYGKIAAIIGKSKTYVANVVRDHSKVVPLKAVNK